MRGETIKKFTDVGFTLNVFVFLNETFSAFGEKYIIFYRNDQKVAL